jgi:hypothetical protein
MLLQWEAIRVGRNDVAEMRMNFCSAPGGRGVVETAGLRDSYVPPVLQEKRVGGQWEATGCGSYFFEPRGDNFAVF